MHDQFRDIPILWLHHNRFRGKDLESDLLRCVGSQQFRSAIFGSQFLVKKQTTISWQRNQKMFATRNSWQRNSSKNFWFQTEQTVFNQFSPESEAKLTSRLQKWHGSPSGSPGIVSKRRCRKTVQWPPNLNDVLDNSFAVKKMVSFGPFCWKPLELETAKCSSASRGWEGAVSFRSPTSWRFQQ